MLTSQRRRPEKLKVIADPVGVKCSLEVLQQVRRIAEAAGEGNPEAGIETGGILYGLREPDGIAILSCAESPCEPAIGPWFLSSDRDRAVFSDLLKPPPGLETVGWFRSHHRTGPPMDGDDEELFHKYFSHGRSVALILVGNTRGPAPAVFYSRRPSGEIVPASARLFAGNPRTAAPLLEREQPRPKWYGNAKWTAALVVLLLLAAAALWLRPATGLDLRAYAFAPGQVRIAWNQHAPAVLRGGSGVLDITDGEITTTIPMDRDQLHSDSVVYANRSTHLSIHFRIDPRESGGPSAQDSIELVARLSPLVAPAESQPTEAAPEQPASSEASAERKSDFPEPLWRLESKQPAPTERAEIPPPPPAPKAEVAPRKTLVLPGRTSPTQVAAAPLPAAPSVDPIPVKSIAAPDLLSNPPLAGAPPPAARTAPASLPRTGRLIWTGTLARRGVVEIEASHTSAGSLAGGLPGVPIFVRILPAEFTQNGLVVYTNDRSKAGATERPTKANGWNTLHFRYDPARVVELVVIEAPNRTNDYSRLVLRNEGRDYSVVVIDWSQQ
jgi:hypothetical protein